ncbi:hypothetical protein V1514DRAFT_343373 [Lipomyces japonicus]|uniref:uncharacterized protein n=1 Tax=Lipomyces japonicus TaxID=56871 RepID=UPI0034CFA53D
MTINSHQATTMSTSQYNAINDTSPLVSKDSYAGVEAQPLPLQPAESYSSYSSYSLVEKVAVVVTTSRRRRPLWSLLLGALFCFIVLTLALSLVRGYSDYSAFRQVNDIPRRVNVTQIFYGEYYASTASFYAPTATPYSEVRY